MHMIIVIHVISALSSIVFTGYCLLFPSKKKLAGSYTLVALTVASGTYLLMTRPVHLAQSCTSGLLYLAVVTTGIAALHVRLAHAHQHI